VASCVARARQPAATATAGGLIGLSPVVEHIEWYRCVVPDGVLPANQDGEVAQFRLMRAGELCDALLREQFTVEAALILHEAGV
jgi:hypothetical protein